MEKRNTTTIPINDLSYRLTFGRYKGCTIAEVWRKNPSYLFWAHKNVKFFKLTDDLAVKAADDAIHKLGDWWWWGLDEHWDQQYD